MEFKSQTNIQPQLNRVKQELLSFEEQESRYQVANPLAASGDRDATRMRIEYYAGLNNLYRKNASPEEKVTLRYLSQQINKLTSQLYPTPLRRLWHSNLITGLRNLISGNQAHFSQLAKEQRELQKKIIYDHNVSALLSAAQKQGFSATIKEPLERMLNLNLPEFSFRHFEVGHPDTDYVLHCRKIPGTPLYHFDKFQATSRPTSQEVAEGRASTIRHDFTVDNRYGIDAGKAANLVNKRPIAIGGGNWLYIDLAKINESFPFSTRFFDLLKKLDELPLKLQQKPGIFSKLVTGLANGNICEVPFKAEGIDGKYKLQVNPLSDAINITDAKGKPVMQHELYSNDQLDKAARVAQSAKHQEQNQDKAKHKARRAA